MIPPLSLLIALPALASGVLAFLPQGRWARGITLGVLAFCVLHTAGLYAVYPGLVEQSGFAWQWEESYAWFALPWQNGALLEVRFALGVDAWSLPLLLLTGIVALAAAWASHFITQRSQAYYSLLLLLTATLFGCFAAQDGLLFFLFFEVMLLPMYFLIAYWGGKRADYAAIKFLIYTLAGSVLVLLGILALGTSVVDAEASLARQGQALPDRSQTRLLAKSMLASGELKPHQRVYTFSLKEAALPGSYAPDSLLHPDKGSTWWGKPVRSLVFLLFFIGFLVKLPGVPFHTWLPDAHVEAATPVSALLAGVLLKVGGYGLLRLPFALFPEAVQSLGWVIGLIGVVSLLYGGLNALAQNDLKKMVAYSSVAHMGFVTLGLATGSAEGYKGALYQMLSHGLISPLLFLLVGVIYERVHSRTIEDYQGLAQLMPRYTAFVGLAFFAGLGLPLFSGFIAEFMVLLSAFRSGISGGPVPLWMAATALAGILLSAAYLLWAFKRMFTGPLWLRNEDWRTALQSDLTRSEQVLFGGLLALIILLGVYPQIVLRLFVG